MRKPKFQDYGLNEKDEKRLNRLTHLNNILPDWETIYFVYYLLSFFVVFIISLSNEIHPLGALVLAFFSSFLIALPCEVVTRTIWSIPWLILIFFKRKELPDPFEYDSPFGLLLYKIIEKTLYKPRISDFERKKERHSKFHDDLLEYQKQKREEEKRKLEEEKKAKRLQAYKDRYSSNSSNSNNQPNSNPNYRKKASVQNAGDSEQKNSKKKKAGSPPKANLQKNIDSHFKKKKEHQKNPSDQKERGDILEKVLRDTELGFRGELFCIEIERVKLNKFYVDYPLHVSKEIGDHLGFDILSKDKEGQDIYIEVKTTRGPLKTPFFLSSNELKTMIENHSQYFIYRVWGFDPEEGTGNLEIYDYELFSELLLLFPSSYRCVVKN